MDSQKTTKIEFTGKTSEYFGIWIVNLLLTLLTFGIYSAWAKVRRKKYFYNNTLIENVGFDYHAKPVAILKGRVIAFVFFICYAFSSFIHPALQGIFMILFFFGLPWLVVRSAMFNARNTSHRGLRFDFVGKVGEAARIFIVLPIITLFTLGLAAPFVSHQKNKFLMSGHKFGLTQFAMQAKVKSFYKVYLILVIVPLIGILAAIVLPAYNQYQKNAASEAKVSASDVTGFVKVTNNQKILLVVNEVPAKSAPADDQIEENTFEEMMKEHEEAKKERWKDMLANPIALLSFIGFMAAYGLFIFGILGYLQARIGNIVWNSTTLDKLSFKSTLRARDFMWIYFSNIVVIMITFGLATPWAQVRLARYRLSKLQIVGDVDFDQFVGDKKAEVKATGEEISDFFDVDLSFG